MKLGKVFQQPAEKLSYTIDYSEALTAGDNVESVIAVSDSADLIVDNVFELDPKIRFWVRGGINGISYKVTITVTTADGRVFQDEIIFRIREL